MASKLSDTAWAVMAQLKGGAVWDGDLISKEGRTELVKAGLAHSPTVGHNALTATGRVIAWTLVSDNWHTGTRN